MQRYSAFGDEAPRTLHQQLCSMLLDTAGASVPELPSFHIDKFWTRLCLQQRKLIMFILFFIV